MMNFSLKRKLRGKGGSSLPMVLAIGLVLVVWVMGLSPIVATQGKASIDVQQQEEDYLQSRSAIEFTKGELYNMVTLHGVPETFAVTYEGDLYSVKAWDAPDYGAYVSAQPSDLDDVPQATENGNKVAAICAVVKPAGEKDYTIQVTTYNQGEAGLTYNTTYTPPVISKMVYPEAYKKTEALPLSDFILVDGKIGGKTVWNSTLTDKTYTHTSYISTNSNGKFTSYKSGFKETFLLLDPDNPSRGDAGSYHSVFKVTAGIPEETPNPDDISDNISFGSAATTPSLSITSATVSGTRMSLTLSSHGSYAMYCCVDQNGNMVHDWQASNSFTVDVAAGEYYYFYCYIAEHVEGSNVVGRSEVSNAAPVFVYQFDPNDYATNLSSDKRYVMYTTSGSKYFALGNNSNNLSSFQIPSGLNLYYEGAPVWKANGSGNNYTFSINNKYLYFQTDLNLGIYVTGKYLLSNSGSTLQYASDNTLSTKSGMYTFYVDITETSGFENTSSRKVYFFPVNTTIPSGSTPARPETSFSVSTLTPDDDTTIKEIRDYYKAQCQSKGVANPVVYVVATGAENNYDVYATGTYNGTPFFELIDNITLQIAPAGYGVSGSALYFMGSGTGINTAGENVYLKADLLVFRDSIATGGGAVFLNPYSASDTLVFFKSGSHPFKAYNFYRVPAGTNLLKVTEEQAAAWLVRDNTGECTEGSIVEYASDGVTVKSIIFPDRVIILETSSSFNYPVINFDIAYASDEQLAHVVSGEAARWTNDGVLSGVDETPNGWYVVCPYVTSISGNVTRSANRIIMKSEADSLDVSGTVRLVSRYWSVDVPKITQSDSSAKFLLYCLTSKENTFIEDLTWLSTFLGDIDYSSDTMQVDYERMTTISRIAGDTMIEAQICRYENGTDLFSGATPEAQKQDLRIEYEIDMINSAFDDEALKATIVERYMHLTGTSTDTLDLAKLLLPCELQLYSNYISFDSSIKYINIRSTLGWSDSSIVINSQETGYTEDEYLYLFSASSAETYTGTMLYFEGNVDVYRRLSKIGTINAGFYYVPAGGTSLLDLCDDTAYQISKEELDTYSKYINENDGSMSSAYVDTGFETEDASEGGFGGGSVN